MIVCDYNELVKALREHAEWMGPNNYELPIAMHDDLLKAADVIEELSMKLHGDEAAIAGMKREIERAVVNATDVAALAQNRFDRLLVENDDLRKRLAETGKTLSWISVEERLPEESEGLNWHEDRTIRFTSVWCCDGNTGTIGVRNRLQCKKTGIEYLDRHTKDTDWHWSRAWWEPTHWMTIVPLPEPPRKEFADGT